MLPTFKGHSDMAQGLDKTCFFETQHFLRPCLEVDMICKNELLAHLKKTTLQNCSIKLTPRGIGPERMPKPSLPIFKNEFKGLEDSKLSNKFEDMNL